MKTKLLSIVMLILMISLIIVSCGNSNDTDSSNGINTDSSTSQHSHSFGNWETTTSATCENEGVKTRYCNCGESQTDVIPVTNHSWLEATCESPKKCSECGKTEGDILEHTWVEATCKVPKTCSVCQATDGEVLEHIWKDATCDTPKTCSICNSTEGSPLGHIWENATCDTPKTCETCKKTEGSPIGHSWNKATCNAPKTCSVCKTTEGEKLDHIWKNATCQAPKTCTLCGKTSGIKTSHTYENGVCSICEKKDPNYIPTYTFGDTFQISDSSSSSMFEITIGKNYSFKTVNQQYDEDHGKTVVQISITVKNLGTSPDHLDIYNVEYYDSTGVEGKEIHTEFDDTFFYSDDLRSGASQTVSMYMYYSGDGDYYITFKTIGLKKLAEVKIIVGK